MIDTTDKKNGLPHLIILICVLLTVATSGISHTSAYARVPQPNDLVPSSTPVAINDDIDTFFDPQRFSYEPDFYVPEIQRFLDAQPGKLKAMHFQVGNRSHAFAEILVSKSTLYSLNPKIILTLFEQQSKFLSTAEPTKEQEELAMGIPAKEDYERGLFVQFHRAILQVRLAVRDYSIASATASSLPDLVFADNTRLAPPPDISLTRYAMSRFFAMTTTPKELPSKLSSFRKTYTRMFEDPRQAPMESIESIDWTAPAQPFLTLPMEHPKRITAFFDHNLPLLHKDGTLTCYWGRTEAALPYQGHTGWDFAMAPPDVVLAAADGTVVFAGNSDDGCATPSKSVILDHGNGYRTLYWHLDSINVGREQTIARGEPVGVAGETGCAEGAHLHFQVQYLGLDVDPYGWCASTPDPWATNPAGQTSVWLWQDMPSPCGDPPPGAIVVDDTSPSFIKTGNWQQSAFGYAGSAIYSISTRGAFDAQPWQVRTFDTPAVAVWQPTLPTAGRYRVLAYIPYCINGLDDSQLVHYRVRHSAGETTVRVDNSIYANGWADLGTYAFDPFDAAHKPLVNVSALAGDHGQSVWVDAVMWIPAE